MTTVGRTLRATATASAVVVLLLLVWHARDVVLLAFAGVLLGVFFRRLALLVCTYTSMSPRWALPIVVTANFGLLIGVIAWRGPAIAAEARLLREALPQAMEQLELRLSEYELGRRIVKQVPSPRELLPNDPDAVSRVTGVVSGTVSTIANFVIILFLGIVFAATPRVYTGGILALVPERHVPRGREVLDRVGDTLWWWLIGRVISMTFIGVITAIGLLLLDVPLALVLALLAALLSFIPNIGPILSAVPAVLLALVQGPRQALWVVALYAGVQTIESYVLAPIIDRKTVHLPPALTVVAQLTLAVFTGMLGIALATPLAAATLVLVMMLYVQDVLGRRDITVQST